MTPVNIAILKYKLINMRFNKYQSFVTSISIIFGNNTCVKLVAAILNISKKRIEDELWIIKSTDSRC